MAISVQDDNNVTVKTKLRTVRDLVVGRCLVNTSTTAITSATTVTLDCSVGDNFTFTPAHTNTINATNIQPGQVVTITYLTSGTDAFVSTFGTGFRSTATLPLSATSARYQVIVFKGDATGAKLNEVSRIAAGSAYA